jgi:hypothetical protein
VTGVVIPPVEKSQGYRNGAKHLLRAVVRDIPKRLND